MRPSVPAVAAATLLALQGVAVAVMGLMELFALGSGAAASMMSAIALIVLTLIAAFALCAFAFGTLRRASWARSGGIFVQVLGIALALASLTVEPKIWLFTIGVGGIAVLGLVLLIAATRRDGASDPRLQPSAADEKPAGTDD
ncbi:hypothetical protein [Microbacterium sp. H1-D42]|uniref:hypothetical protein n=1 Tax=Microbacterium sp. H1-D42 TaxID=2925844 RepID=UPI001F539F1C|nr:hypothetical protein [Microbacterium sp. H1-D42]UNK69676.1 hypothetical protein MNR00_10870 [Microbacterium sp. H1-D42]